MSNLSARNNYKRGLAALVDSNYQDATVFFHRAVEVEKQRKVRQPEMRYLSYYGLSLAMSRRSADEAVEACRTAVRLENLDPDLFLNLGLVYLVAGKTSLALESFERGLLLAPHNSILRRELARIDRRCRPVLRILPRNHCLNVWLGRLRNSVLSVSRRWAAPGATQVASR